MIDYRESRDGVELRWELAKNIPPRVRESMGMEALALLGRMHDLHPGYVFCLSMECWGQKIPPTTLTTGLPHCTQPSGST